MDVLRFFGAVEIKRPYCGHRRVSEECKIPSKETQLGSRFHGIVEEG